MRRQLRRTLAVLAAVIGMTVAVAGPAGAQPPTLAATQAAQSTMSGFHIVHPDVDWWW